MRTSLNTPFNRWADEAQQSQVACLINNHWGSILPQIGFDLNNFGHLICSLDSEVQIYWFILIGTASKICWNIGKRSIMLIINNTKSVKFLKIHTHTKKVFLNHGKRPWILHFKLWSTMNSSFPVTSSHWFNLLPISKSMTVPSHWVLQFELELSLSQVFTLSRLLAKSWRLWGWILLTAFSPLLR